MSETERAIGQIGMNQGQDGEFEVCGKWLSTVVPCGQVYLPYGKPVFECKCGVPFPRYVVLRFNVEEILEIHRG